MRKLLAYLWLPITAGLALLLIYGSLTINDLKIKNQNLEQKQKRLEEKFTELQNNLGSVQVAGIKQEKPKVTGKISSSASTPTPATTPQSSSTPKPATTVTPTPTPTPQPTPTPTPVFQATVTIENLSSFPVELQAGDTAFSILLRAAELNNFSIEYQNFEGFGAMVNCIAGVCAHDNFYWAFYYNGSYSMVGASAQEVANGDTTAWKFESF